MHLINNLHWVKQAVGPILEFIAEPIKNSNEAKKRHISDADASSLRDWVTNKADHKTPRKSWQPRDLSGRPSSVTDALWHRVHFFKTNAARGFILLPKLTVKKHHQKQIKTLKMLEYSLLDALNSVLIAKMC